MTSVAVVIPAYNAAASIAEALASVAAQDHAPDEIVVVDDGSSDQTSQIAESSGLRGLRVIRQRQAGPAAARNAAIASVKTDWIAFLDADDIWRNTKLSRQLELAANEPEVDFWLGATEGVAMEGAARSGGLFQAEFSSRAFFQLGAALVRRRLFDVIGRFDTSLRYGEDFDWVMRAQQHGVKLKIHEDTVLIYRRHGANMTNDIKATKAGFMRALRKSIDRKRGQES